MTPSAPRAAYVHIPFCQSKCGYCDFNSYAGLNGLYARYVDAILRQILSAPAGPALRTVFFGGGTPSLLPAPDLIRILNALAERFGVETGAEVTLEANPESADPGKLKQLREGGFNRISIGAQSFDDEMLRKLGRVHTHERFLKAFRDARDAGFDNISFDIMFGLPGQSLTHLQETISRALDLRPEHISAYCLSIEEDTPFHELVQSGTLELPDDDLQADMFLSVRRDLTGAGYEHYEISNYAYPGKRCAHNEVYWRNDPYYGFGAGAVCYVNGERTRWEPDPLSYVLQTDQDGRPKAASSEHMEGDALMGETMMLLLRTSDGVDIQREGKRFGVDAAQMYSSEIERFQDAGLLVRADGHIRLTGSGMLVANEVLAEFLR